MMGLSQQSSELGRTGSKASSSPVMLQHNSSMSATADEQLFKTPTDLVCPITLSLFQDPVCNALGQVYERAAIQRHLLQAAVSSQPPTDPVSNAVLPSLDLVPVWPMRSRAAEYRDSTIRACVQQAAGPDCSDPVKYLRRAAELVLTGGDANSRGRLSSSGSSAAAAAVASPPSPLSCAAMQHQQAQSNSSSPAGAGTVAGQAPSAASPGAAGAAAGACIPGMTLDFANYLAAHQGSQYDALVLKYFGNELLRAGCPDAASNVFYRLLLEAEDKVQQAEYLQLCLDCWTCSSSSSSSSAGGCAEAAGSNGVMQQEGTQLPKVAGADGVKQQEQPGVGGSVTASTPAAAAAANPLIIQKLADFVQRQRCLSPMAIVQMLVSTHHGSDMALQLCQVLLSRSATAAAAAGPAENAEALLALPGGLGGVLEVLLELVQLSNSQVLGQLQQLTAQLQQLQAASQQQQQQQAAAAQEGAPDAGGGMASGSAAATAADDVQQAAGQGMAGAGQAASGGSSAAAAAEGASGCAGRRRRGRGRVWRGGKDAGVALGRLLQVAAAGTLAAASLASSNHPVLRLARVGPLLYLLRCGL